MANGSTAAKREGAGEDFGMVLDLDGIRVPNDRIDP
jgi:hypothetical protein